MLALIIWSLKSRDDKGTPSRGVTYMAFARKPRLVMPLKYVEYCKAFPMQALRGC